MRVCEKHTTSSIKLKKKKHKLLIMCARKHKRSNEKKSVHQLFNDGPVMYLFQLQTTIHTNKNLMKGLWPSVYLCLCFFSSWIWLCEMIDFNQMKVNKIACLWIIFLSFCLLDLNARKRGNEVAQNFNGQYQIHGKLH